MTRAVATLPRTAGPVNVPVADRRDLRAWVPAVLFCLLIAITAVSSGNVNPVLLGHAPDETGSGQQVATLALWALVGGLSLALPARIAVAPTLDVVALLVFIAYAALSCLWSGGGLPSGLKAVALGLTTVAAYRVAVTLPLAAVVSSLVLGHLAVVGASLAAVYAWPQVAVIGTWMHHGQWSGIFESKQTLGMTGAFLIFFSACRLKLGGGWVAALAGVVLGAVAVVGSGSRGGGALALAAATAVVFAGRRLVVARGLVVVPAILTALVVLMLFDLRESGRKVIELFGTETDLTERVVIWQYALARIGPTLYFGYGLDGFWSLSDAFFTFKREHGWVLDNFHNGYLTILVETGLVGLGLFFLATCLFAVRMWGLARRRLADPALLNVAASFVALVFLINLTETTFLRSTNLISVMLTLMIFASAGRPVATGRGRR